MAFGALLGKALLGPLVGGVVDQLFGGPSSSDKQATQQSSRVAGLQGDQLQIQNDALRRLQQGLGVPSASGGILGATGGRGFQLGRGLNDESNIDAILANVNFDQIREEDLNQILAGLVRGNTSAVQQNANIAQQNANNRAGSIGQLSQNISQGFGNQALMNAIGGLGAQQAAPVLSQDDIINAVDSLYGVPS